MTNDLLDCALSYAERGWHVFPVHTPQSDGSCSCRRTDCSRSGKHPRVSAGRNSATTDPTTIRAWWGAWPDANIGIATGKESGMIVLDVDEGGDDTLSALPTPETVEQITGSGGRHLIYQRPDDAARYLTKVKFMPGLDSRADGGYIVAPPSLHPSGRQYEWEGSSDPFDGIAMMPCPQWLLDAIGAEAVDATAPVPEWNPDGELPHNIIDMLSAIPADDYETWRDVGMALHYTDPADGLGVWDWWSSTSTEYDADGVRREWRNFSRRGHQTTNPITISTIRRLAEQHGWVDPDIEHGAEAAASLMESHQKRLAERLTTDYQSRRAPADSTDQPDVMPPSGLIRGIAEHIIARSVRPQPLLAVMAATAFVATLAGRKYQTETGLRTNLYVVGLAESGAGKDQARKEINNLALAADVDQHIGGDRIASGPGVVSALHAEPSRLFMLDEIGMMLQAMTGQRADPHKRDMMSTLMTLYSSAGSVYRGAEYADQRDRPRQDIINPNACIYGTSTHSQFYAALSSSQGVDGTLSRLIVASSDMHRPTRQRPRLGRPSSSLTSAIQSLAAHDPIQGNLSGAGGPATDRTAQVVAMDAPVFEAWEALDDDMTAYMRDDASRSVYSRVAENAAKLALTYAVARDHQSPRVDAEAFQWGREIALWAANTMMREVARNVADNDMEAAYKRVLNLIRDAGADGVTRRHLLRKVKTMRKQELEGIISVLCESGEVAIENQRNERGSPTTRYVSVDHHAPG